MLADILFAGAKVLAYLLVLVLGLWGWFCWSHRRLIRGASKMPSTLPKLPVIGHIHHTVGGWEEVSQMFLKITEDAVTTGTYNVCFWFGPLPYILIHKLEDIQTILTSSISSTKAEEMQNFKYFMGNGLLITHGDTWKIKRRHLSPLFHPRNLHHLLPTFNRNSRELVANLSKHIGKGSFNVLDHTMTSALQSVCHLIFGPEPEFDTKSELFHDVRSGIEELATYFAKRLICVWLRFELIFNFLFKKELKKLKETLRNFNQYAFKITGKDTFMKTETNTLPKQSDFIGDGHIKHKGLITLLNVYSEMEKCYSGISKKDLCDEIATLYGTGTDTLGVSTASCLLILAQYQDIQERMYKEIMSVTREGCDVTAEDLKRMPYLDSVYKETLRWSSVVPYVIRKTSADLKISTGTIPAGAKVVLGLRGPLRDPSIFTNPKDFDPERFSENITQREKFAFLPFSGGPRNCIGIKYVQTLMKVQVVHILRKYKLFTNMNIHEIRWKFLTTLTSSEGYNVELQLR